MQKLNVATMATAGTWLDTQAPRFVHQLDRHSPGTNKLVLLLIEDTQRCNGAYIQQEVTKARKLFDGVKIHMITGGMGRHANLAYFDMLRAFLPAVFGEPELLYMDLDIDTVAPLDGIIDVAPEAGLLWLADPTGMYHVIEALKICGFKTPAEGAPILQAGMLYVRGNHYADLQTLKSKYGSTITGKTPVPGTVYWNMLKQQHGEHAVQLPREWGTTMWDVENLTKVRTLHYTGRFDVLRNHVSYNIKSKDKPPFLESLEIKP